MNIVTDNDMLSDLRIWLLGNHKYMMKILLSFSRGRDCRTFSIYTDLHGL